LIRFFSCTLFRWPDAPPKYVFRHDGIVSLIFAWSRASGLWYICLFSAQILPSWCPDHSFSHQTMNSRISHCQYLHEKTWCSHILAFYTCFQSMIDVRLFMTLWAAFNQSGWTALFRHSFQWNSSISLPYDILRELDSIGKLVSSFLALQPQWRLMLQGMPLMTCCFSGVFLINPSHSRQY
jgi:hypothetical protein